jgi:iron complex transport system substrate-binding protein
MSRKFLFPLLLALTLIFSACAPAATPAPTATDIPTVMETAAPAETATAEVSPTAETITLTDGLKRTVTLKGPAQHIVSLAPSSTEILYAIGAGPQIIGRDKNSDYPEEAKKVTDIGGSDSYNKVNTEAILAIHPDLVLAADITPQEQIKALEDLGLTVFMLPNPTDLNGMYENLRTAAKLTGHEAETETLIASLQARVKTVEDKLATTTEKPLMFYEIDGTDAKAPWTPGPGSFIETMIVLAGGRNAGAGLKDQWAQISLEELVKQDPDFIVLGDAVWGNVTPELVKQRAGWASIKAVKNDAIFPFDDNLLSRPGPRLVDGLEALAKLLHPDLFK